MKKVNRGLPVFTLIELTIVVAIIVILAAIAIPNFLTFQVKAKQSEAKSILPLIASYQLNHKLHTGKFLPCPKNPSEPGGKWDRNVAQWKELGFEPIGVSYYSYEVVLEGDSYVVKATANLDTDDYIDEWEFTGADFELINYKNDVSNYTLDVIQ